MSACVIMLSIDIVLQSWNIELSSTIINFLEENVSKCVYYYGSTKLKRIVKVENVASLYVEPLYGKPLEIILIKKTQCLRINLQRSMALVTEVFLLKC
jgi:hypothetical protein